MSVDLFLVLFVKRIVLTRFFASRRFGALRFEFVAEGNQGKVRAPMYGQVTSSRRSLALFTRWASPLALVIAAGCSGAPEGSDLTLEDKGIAGADVVSSEEFTGGERVARPKVFAPSSDSASEIALATELSLEHIAGNLESFGLRSLDEVQPRMVWIDELGMAHAKFQQVWKDVEVFGAQIIVHLDQTGQAFETTNGLVPWVQKDLSVEPSVEEGSALHDLLGKYDCASCLTDKPVIDKQVLRREDQDHLVYRVQLRRIDGSPETSMPVIFVDAHTGEQVWSYDNLQTTAATGTASTLYSGSVTFGTSNFSGTYYLEDVTKKIGTFTYNKTTTSAYRLSDTDNSWSAGTTADASYSATDAHFAATKTYDYFLNVHGRNGIDGAGGPGAYTAAENGSLGLISSVVRYSTNYNNAFWDGSKMTYGDGDGSTFSPLVSLDIGGHEMTHGVTERTANLTYQGESGALNESMSDVFGAMVERSVKGEANMWKIGESVYTPANGTSDALRYMDTPHGAANSGFTSDDDPDHYDERYTGTSDNGGVHINSGIANNAFYLAAKGGTHHRSLKTVTGMGPDQAAAIWYKALTTYMTASTNFAGARTATLNAATAIYGGTSTQYNTIMDAWCAVGVGTCYSAGGGGGGGGSTGAELLTNGTFEASSSPWVMSGTGALYTNNGNYPQAGTGYPYFGNANSVTGQMYQQITIPAAATTATFTFYLNVTSAETTTTTQYDKLFVEVRNTAGTLLATLATYSNLNKGTAGVYSQKSFNLLAYKGQTIRVQFRTTCDSAAITTFRVDTASVK